MDRSAYNEAIADLRMALGLAEELSDSPGRRLLRLGLQTNYGQALLYGRGHGSPETTIAFIRARELAARVEDAAESWRITEFGLEASFEPNLRRCRTSLESS